MEHVEEETVHHNNNQQDDNECSSVLHHHSIVVVAKCPIAGKSKTRLIPLLGQDGSSKLAKAMLSDVLVTLSSECCESRRQNNDANKNKVRKILFYAPADYTGETIMRDLLRELGLSEVTDDRENGWMLLPMIQSDLRASNLGDILTDILTRTRKLRNKQQQGMVMFLGMDAPELPVEEIVARLFDDQQATTICRDLSSEAVLCPANDGGYGMLCVPPQAPTNEVFQGIRWSDPLTALGQIKALTDCGIPVRLGRMMNDVDEPEDVTDLCRRLAQAGVHTTSSDEDDVLLRSSTSASREGEAQTGQCRHTIRVLKELRLLS